MEFSISKDVATHMLVCCRGDDFEPDEQPEERANGDAGAASQQHRQEEPPKGREEEKKSQCIPIWVGTFSE